MSVSTVKAVVDTNLIISAFIAQRGAPHQVMLTMNRRRFTPVVSPVLVDEYIDVLLRPHFAARYGVTERSVRAFERFLMRRALIVAPLPSDELPVTVRDEADNHVLATALAGNADYLVTGDNDLLVLANDPRLGSLRIVTAAEFLDALA